MISRRAMCAHLLLASSSVKVRKRNTGYEATATEVYSPANKTGGSNLLYHGIDGVCKQELLLLYYVNHKSMVNEEIVKIWQSGQRHLRLSIPLLFDYTTIMADPAAVKWDDILLAFETLLREIKNTGFDSVIIVMGDGNYASLRYDK
jgi:hypothetical protein